MNGRPRVEEIPAGACTRQFTAIALHSFFMASGAHLIGLGIPIFVLRTWSSDFFSGVAISIPSFFYIITTLLFGRISAKIGRKNSMVVSLAMNQVIFVLHFSLLVLAPVTGSSWMLPVIVACRGGEGIAQGLFWPTLEARISDVASLNCTTIEHRSMVTGRGVSFFNLGWNVGLLFGAFAFWVIMISDSLEIVIFLSIIVQAMNAAIYKFSSDVDKPENQLSHQEASEPRMNGGEEAGSRLKGTTWTIPATLGILLVFFYGFSLQWIYTTATNFCFSIGVVPLLGVLEALRLGMQTITSSWFKHGSALKLRTIVATAIAVITLTIIMGFSANPGSYMLMFAWFPLLGLVMGTMYAESLNMVELARTPQHKGYLMGLFESAGSMGNFSGPVIAGYITQAILVEPYPTSFFIGATSFACLMLAIASIVLIVSKKMRNA